MAGIEKRGDYKPRSQREKEAYRLVLAGGGTGVAGVITFVLAVAGVGVTGFFPPILLLLLSAFFVWRFMRVTGQR
jgi:CHASE2 domain-containing sensor protein